MGYGRCALVGHLPTSKDRCLHPFRTSVNWPRGGWSRSSLTALSECSQNRVASKMTIFAVAIESELVQVPLRKCAAGEVQKTTYELWKNYQTKRELIYWSRSAKS